MITITNTKTRQRAQFPLPFTLSSLSKISIDETFEGVMFIEGIDTFGYGLDGYLSFYELKDFLQSYINQQNPYHFNYMMLGRLQQDCDYFLGYGGRYEPQLWAGSVEGQIAEMKKLWQSFPEQEKPEWLTWEQILDYEKRMKNDEL